MSKICGYSCEHNKGGVCQITNCDKKIIMTTTTEPQILTRWQDPTIEDLKREMFDLQCDYIIVVGKHNELADRIQKAIEHIEKHQLVYQSQYEEMSGFDNHLLNILKGEENDK